MSAAAFKIPTIYTVIDKFTAPIRKMAGAHHAFASSLETGVARGERLFRKLTPVLSDASKQFLSFASSAALAAAIIGGISFSVKAIKNYEVAVQAFRTIVSDLNDKQFAAYERKVREVALATKKSSIDVVKAFEMIAGLNAEFAKTPAAIGEVTESAIILAKASRDDLGKSASNLTGILNQYNLQASQSMRVTNSLAAGQAVGASTITETADALTVYGAVAKTANQQVEESIALVQVLAGKQIKGAEAGTALRGSTLALQKAGLGYRSGIFKTRDALVEFNEKLNKLTTAKQKDAYMEKVFGVINRTSGTILAQNIDLYDKFTKGVTGTTEAFKAAEINSNSLTNRLDEMQAKWVTLITTSGTTNTNLDKVKKTVVFLTDNMETLISVGYNLLVFFISWKAVLIASRIALGAYNIALGITGALSGVASVAIGRSSIAMGAYKVATWLATGATWAWNAALYANPIGLVIIAIAALIALIVSVIQKWNEWGAAVSLFMGPLGMVISLVQSLRRNWDMITEAFTKGGIIAGIKAIGRTILDALIMPMQQLAQILAKWTGLEVFENAAKGMAIIRKAMDVNIATDERGRRFSDATEANSAGDWGVKDIINPKTAQRDGMRDEITKLKQFNSTLTIKDLSGRAELDNSNPLVQMLPQVGTTRGGW